MGQVSGLIKLLSREEMELLHRSALHVLAEVGMRIDHEGALLWLDAAGCDVDMDRRVVRMPPPVVEQAVSRLRSQFVSGTPAGEPGVSAAGYAERMPHRYSAIYFSSMPRRIHTNFEVNAGGFPPFIYDLDGHRRPATLRDVRDSIRLADALDEIDLVGVPCCAAEVPEKLRPVVMAAELVKHTSKLGGIEAWSVRDVEYITRIAEVVAGSQEALRRRPILVGYGEARSPLCLDHNMAAVFIEYIQRGFPQSLDTMPAAGTTAPATSAGTLVLGLAETLGGLTLAYAVREDAVVSIDVNPTLTDMRTLIYPYAGADRLPLVAAALQMLADYYGRPGGCHGGKTDACVPGVQAGVEKALSILFPVLAGAAGVGTLGQLENALTFSFEQLVMDAEIVRYIRRMLQGFVVDEVTTCVEIIKEVGIGGNYLGHLHTARNFRREFWRSELMERYPWEGWQSQPVKGFEAKARAKAKQLIAHHHPEPLSAYQVRAIDEIVEAARRDPWYQ